MEYNYQQVIDPSGNINLDMILRLPDNAYIPSDPDNQDWVQYQLWLSEGGVPLPPDA